MILSQACKYGLQAVLYLAEHGSEPILRKEIAEKLDIPPFFLAKILQDLSRRGLLLSYKGRGGGFTLARPAGNIRLIDVVEAIEGTGFSDECVLGLPDCSDESACAVHAKWKLAKAEILSMLGEKSVKELVSEVPRSGQSKDE